MARHTRGHTVSVVNCCSELLRTVQHSAGALDWSQRKNAAQLKKLFVPKGHHIFANDFIGKPWFRLLDMSIPQKVVVLIIARITLNQ